MELMAPTTSASSPTTSLEVPFFEGEDWQAQRERWVEQLVEQLRGELAGFLASEEGWRQLAERRWGHLSSFMNQWWASQQLRAKNPQGIELDLPVLSASAWKALGRTVQDQHRRHRGRPAQDDRYAVQQLRPLRRRYPVTQRNEQTGEEETIWREGQLVGFAVYDAYHLSATDGPSLEGLQLAQAGQDTARLDEDLERLLATQLVRVERGSGSRTRLHREQGRIELAGGVEGEQRVLELLACTMELLGGPEPQDADSELRQRRALASRGAALVVGQRYGLAPSAQQLADLAAFAQARPQELQAVTGDLQRRVRSFLEVCDPVTAALAARPSTRPASKRAPKRPQGAAALAAALR